MSQFFYNNFNIISCWPKRKDQCAKTVVYLFRCDGRSLASQLPRGRVFGKETQAEVDGHTEKSLELAPPLFASMWRNRKINLAYNYS